MQRPFFLDTESEVFWSMSELEREQYMLNTPAQCRLRAELMHKGVIRFDEAEDVTDVMFPQRTKC